MGSRAKKINLPNIFPRVAGLEAEDSTLWISYERFQSRIPE